MFVTEIRPLNKKKSRILFDDGEDLLPDEVYEKGQTPRDVSAAQTDADEKRAGR